MENWLHFGINNVDIKKQYSIVLEMQFPNPPEEDELYDLFSELVEIDAYIMGVVSRYFKNGLVDKINCNYDEVFLQILDGVGVTSIELDYILQYKSELDKLMTNLIQQLSI